MKKISILLFAGILLIFIGLAGCSKSNNPTNSADTNMPVITGLTAQKTQIMYGGQDPAIITCAATGGNLKYVWEVDLGDIIPLNGDHSKVSYTGASCCVGEKTIKCTVSNDKGSISKTIIITILENLAKPEIISIESDKTDINAGAGDIASLVCYAIGGKLKYKWETDCGEVNLINNDSTKISYKATTPCVGLRNIKCTVTNEKGEDSKTFQINVSNK